jgi:hypothetical protein
MAALIITPMEQKSQRPFIVEFDSSKESQEEVEQRHGVSYSEYFQDRQHAERALNMRETHWV